MKKYNISTIEEFFEYCKKKFNYGWIDQGGKRHEGVNNGGTYSLQSPKEQTNIPCYYYSKLKLYD